MRPTRCQAAVPHRVLGHNFTCLLRWLHSLQAPGHIPLWPQCQDPAGHGEDLRLALQRLRRTSGAKRRHPTGRDFRWLSGDTKVWTELFSSVERVPYGAVVMAESLPTEVYSDGVWAAKEPSENCPGASTGEQVFKSLCDAAELHRSNIASLLQHGVSPLELNIAHGFKLGLLQAGTSQTMYFWAKAIDVNGVDIAGMDGDNNICFSISQREATLVRRNALHDGNTAEDRITKSIPLMSDDQLTKGKWIFFALTVDVTLSTVTVMAGESSAVEEVADLGGWGCNGLQFVVNLGGEVLLSPVSVLQAALPFGDLQHVQMRQQPVYAGLVGPRTTRLQRLATWPRKRADFVSKVVGISPPLLLQERRTDATPRRCREDKVVSALEERLQGAKAAMCVKPYDCEGDHRVEVHAGCDGNVTGEADSVTQDAEPLFFGRKAYTYKGKKSFPEFPWALGNAVVVRSGRTLRPSAQYLDSATQEVALVMCIYSVDFQVAGLLEVRLDFTCGWTLRDQRCSSAWRSARSRCSRTPSCCSGWLSRPPPHAWPLFARCWRCARAMRS